VTWRQPPCFGHLRYRSLNAENFRIDCNGAIESKNSRVFYFSRLQI
jgi:hypothetical protein